MFRVRTTTLECLVKMTMAVGPAPMTVAESPIPLGELVAAPGSWIEDLMAASWAGDQWVSRPT
jgi:hypothetical protein